MDKCARCAAVSTCAVWGWRLCASCVRAWDLEAPEPGSDFDDVGRAYRDFTANWLERQRKAR